MLTFDPVFKAKEHMQDLMQEAQTQRENLEASLLLPKHESGVQHLITERAKTVKDWLAHKPHTPSKGGALDPGHL